MGFGGIIATGITVIVLIVAGYLVIAGLAYSVDSANAAGTAVRDAAGDRMHTSLAVTNVTKVDAYALSFNVTNTGSTAIANVTLMDVFVLPVSLGRVTSCQYLPFADNASHDIPDHWFVVGWVGKSVGAACMLEPGGQMAIQCEFRYQVPVNPVGYVEVVAPDGVKAYQSYKY